jgi:hypothetical protein
MTDPLHEVGSPGTAWTTVNTAENFPGVATPMGWTFWRDPLERGMRGAFRYIGVLPASAVTVAASIDDRFSAAVYGRFAANVDCLWRMADMMPGTSGEALEEQLLGSVLAGLRGPGRVAGRMVLSIARRYIPLREVGKAAFLQTIDGARAATRFLGAHLVADGVLDAPGDVCFLTVDELTGRLPGDVRGVVAQRRAVFERYRALRLPDTWVGVPEPEEYRPDPEGTSVRGLAVSPGVVEGPARVVLDIGGPLSHGAIVARELGIPCVINTGDGTRTIRTGDLVRVDGSAGSVEILKSVSERTTP